MSDIPTDMPPQDADIAPDIDTQKLRVICQIELARMLLDCNTEVFAGGEVAAIREHAELTQEEFAAQLRVGCRTLQGWEAAGGNPVSGPAAIVLHLASILAVERRAQRVAELDEVLRAIYNKHPALVGRVCGTARGGILEKVNHVWG